MHTSPITPITLKFSWVKRANLRGMQYSHIQVCRALQEIGLTPEVRAPATMIAFVTITISTKEERKALEERLKRIHPRFPYRVDIVDITR